ncbi:hypothetical protein HGA64_00420 [Candidatus Falkowbacteria bacterium]|nr:hypothetical protein [Candidatus Falkowbacteria bacterium]
MDIKPIEKINLPEQLPTHSPERPVMHEQRVEAAKPTEKVGEANPPTHVQQAVHAIEPGATDSVDLKKVETVMSAGLDEMYRSMSPEKQATFRIAGEATARQINQLLSESKIKAKKIINLLKEWLKLIPGVNRFFLEQEAKIKADELISLRQQK